MHVDWSCFALILLEDEALSTNTILSYKRSQDPIAPGLFRLPGDNRVASDNDPMKTLIRSVIRQTGIDITKKSSIPLFSHRETIVRRPPGVTDAKKYTRSERYYLLRISVTEYIERTGFELGDEEEIEWQSTESIGRSSLYFPVHQHIVGLFRNTLTGA